MTSTPTNESEQTPSLQSLSARDDSGTIAERRRRKGKLIFEVRRQIRDLVQAGYSQEDIETEIETAYGEVAEQIGLSPMTWASLILFLYRLYKTFYSK